MRRIQVAPAGLSLRPSRRYRRRRRRLVRLLRLARQSNDEPQAHRYTEAVVGAPSRVNPLFAHLNDADRDLASLVFSGLTRLGADGGVLPDLAETWEISEDGRSFTFHLRIRRHLARRSPVHVRRRHLHLLPSRRSEACRRPGPGAALAAVGLLRPGRPDGCLSIAGGVRSVPGVRNDRHSAQTSAGRHRRHRDLDKLLSTSSRSAQALTALINVDQTRALLRANDKYHLGAPRLAEIELLFLSDVATAAASVVNGEARASCSTRRQRKTITKRWQAIDGLKSYEVHRTAFYRAVPQHRAGAAQRCSGAPRYR